MEPNHDFEERGFTRFVVEGQRGTYILLEVLREENQAVCEGLPAPVFVVTAHGPLSHVPNSLGHSGMAKTSRLIGAFVHREEAKEAAERAMEGLVVVGDAETLVCTGDECWRAFLGFVVRNGLVKGDVGKVRDEVDEWDGKEGRLEKGLRARDAGMSETEVRKRVIGLRGFSEEGEEQGEMVMLEEEDGGEEELLGEGEGSGEDNTVVDGEHGDNRDVGAEDVSGTGHAEVMNGGSHEDDDENEGDESMIDQYGVLNGLNLDGALS